MSSNPVDPSWNRFTLERTDPSQPDPSTVFSVSPAQGSLLPTERPTAVHILFNHDKEVCIEEEPLLQCQVTLQPRLPFPLQLHNHNLHQWISSPNSV